MVLAFPISTTSTLALQDGAMQWRNSYGGGYNYNDLGKAIIEKADGGFIIIGTTYPPCAGSCERIGDAVLMETDANGNQTLWQTFGTQTLYPLPVGQVYHSDAAEAAIATSDGGIAIAGYTHRNATERDFWLVKLIKQDVYWDVQWMRTYGGNRDDEAYSVIEKADGGFVLAGKTKSTDNESWDILVVETNSVGELERMRTYYSNQNEDEICYDVIQTTDGGFALLGTVTYDYVDGLTTYLGLHYIYLIKTDSSWNQEAEMSYYASPGSSAFGYSLIQTPDEGFMIAGSIDMGSDREYDGLVLKVDPEVSYNNFSHYVAEWAQTFGTPWGDGLNSVAQTSDGGYVFAGYIAKFIDINTPLDYDFLLIKMDAYGNEQWSNSYSGTWDMGTLYNYDWVFANAVIETQDHGFALVGKAQSGSYHQHYEMFVVKTYPEPGASTITPSVITRVSSVRPIQSATFFTPATRVTFVPSTIIPGFMTVAVSPSTMPPGTVPPSATTTSVRPLIGATVTVEPSPGMTIMITIPPPASTSDTTPTTIHTITQKVTPTTGLTTSPETTTSQKFTITPKTTPSTTPITTSVPTTSTPTIVTVTDTETETETEPGPPVPGFMTLSALLGLFIMALFSRRRRKAK